MRLSGTLKTVATCKKSKEITNN